MATPSIHRARAPMQHLSIPLDPSKTGRETEALETALTRLIVGQDEAIQAILAIYQTSVAGLAPSGRPIGNFLFLGPTGSGKTRIVEATAEALLHNPRALIKIDCAEFQHSHEIAKLIGSPPGYLGHRETHALLSQEVLNQYHTESVKLSFVLFDEVEKASDALWNLLLGILDKGTLTLGDNRRVDFSRALIFMTSNLGATEMNALLYPRFGFGSRAAPSEMTASKLSRVGLAASRRKFTPEFVNRLDRIVTFNPLGAEALDRILDIELNMVQQRIFNAGERAFVFKMSLEAKVLLIEQGTDVKYGARHLKRAIERLLVQPLSNLLASQQLRRGDSVLVDRLAKAGALSFFKDAEGLPVDAMTDLVDRSVSMPSITFTNGASIESARTQSARSSKRG